MVVRNNLCSVIALFLGGLALCIVLAHFWLGPVTPQTPIRDYVVSETIAIKKAAIDAIKGKTVAPKGESEKNWHADRIIDTSASVLAIMAIILAGVASIRKENKDVIAIAVLLGVGTIAFQIAMIALAVVVVIAVIIAVLSFLS